MKLFSFRGKKVKVVNPNAYTEEEKAAARKVAAESAKRMKRRKITLLCMLGVFSPVSNAQTSMVSELPLPSSVPSTMKV